MKGWQWGVLIAVALLILARRNPGVVVFPKMLWNLEVPPSGRPMSRQGRARIA